MLLSWQTRTLAQFIAATAMSEDNSPLVEAAAEIDLDPEEEQEAPKVSEPAVGSYERFMGMMQGAR